MNRAVHARDPDAVVLDLDGHDLGVARRTSRPVASASTTERYPPRGRSPKIGAVELFPIGHPAQRVVIGPVARIGLDLGPQCPVAPAAPRRLSAHARRRTTRSRRGRSRSGPSRCPIASTASQNASDSACEYLSVSARSRRRRSARSYADSDGIGSPASRATPSSSHSADNGLPIGWWIHEPPRSTGVPARSMVCSRPPMRSRASSTT